MQSPPNCPAGRLPQYHVQSIYHYTPHLVLWAEVPEALVGGSGQGDSYQALDVLE